MPVLAIALLLPSLFLSVFWYLPCHGIALIGAPLIGAIDRQISDWLLLKIWGLDLGCLALEKNVNEGRTIAIKEPRHV